MKTLIFYTSTNAFGRKDATGAFIPEAKRIARKYNVPEEDIIGIPCRWKSKRWRLKRLRCELLNRYLDGNCDYGAVMFLCHGHPRKIQFGFSQANLKLLAVDLECITRVGAKIFFFCCSVSRNKWAIPWPKWNTDLSRKCQKSFAQLVSDESDRVVIGHYTRGHTTRNPYVVKHMPNGDPYWTDPWMDLAEDQADFKEAARELRCSLKDGKYELVVG